MVESFEPGALLGHVYTLQDGLRVRLRLARDSDAPAVAALVARRGRTGNLEPARLVHFDPRRRYVVCATALMDSAETLLGIGAISLAEAPEPELLAVAEEAPDGLTQLLRQALTGLASTLGARRAA